MPRMTTPVFLVLCLAAASASAAPEAIPRKQQPPLAPLTTAAADAPAAMPAEGKRPMLLVGASAGGLLAQPFGKLGASLVGNLQLGYVLPYGRGEMVVALEGGYAAPGAEGSAADPRLAPAGGSYKWSLVQREGRLGLTFLYRALALGTARITPFAGIGPRMWLLSSRITGSAGSSRISESFEQSTKVGFALPVGVEYALGPGRLTGQLDIAWAPIDHTITGDANVGSLDLAVGYRMLF